jgi:hypothetical protein
MDNQQQYIFVTQAIAKLMPQYIPFAQTAEDRRPT